MTDLHNLFFRANFEVEVTLAPQNATFLRFCMATEVRKICYLSSRIVEQHGGHAKSIFTFQFHGDTNEPFVPGV
jgi:hypothetical protein